MGQLFENDLCTVVPTILDKQCFNDTISLPGTCYEDSCCTSVETAVSFHYRLAQLSHIFFSICSIITCIAYIVRYSSKHILPYNIQVFKFILLLLIIIHSISVGILHLHHLLRSFHIEEHDPCSIRVRVDFCAPFRYSFSYCTITLALCQYTIYIDRILSIWCRNYCKKHKTILIVLIINMFLVSFILIKWIYRNENGEKYLLSCLNIPLESIVDLSIVTAILFPLNILCLVLSVILFRIFQNKTKSSRFDVKRHFNASINVDSSDFLWRTTATQAVFTILYPIFSISMRLFYEQTPRPLHLTIATLSYIFSIYCWVVPCVMVHYAHNYRVVKKESILCHLKIKSVGAEGANNYFNSLKQQWG